MKLQPELLDPNSPPGLEVFDIAPDHEHAVLTYPDKPTFLEDGRRLLLTIDNQPWLCHLDDNCKLEPIKDKLPGLYKEEWSLTPGGRYLVYQAIGAADDELLVRRLDFQTGHVDDVFTGKGNIPGTHASFACTGKQSASHNVMHFAGFSIQAVSRDGQHFAGRVYLGDGKTHQAGYGIVVLNAKTSKANVIYKHENLNNTHLQYSRQTDGRGMYDLMVQMNHGSITDADGKLVIGLGPPSDLGVDVHIIHDDGSNWRDLPFGRDGVEGTIGHQVWRGNTGDGVTITLENLDTSYGWAQGSRQSVVAGHPVPADNSKPHIGRIGRENQRVDLSKDFQNPRFCHLGVDDTGLRFSFDTFPVFNGHVLACSSTSARPKT